MKTVKIDLIPERKAKTVYTMEMDKAEVILIRAVLYGYIANYSGPYRADNFIELANELMSSLSSLPATGE